MKLRFLRGLCLMLMAGFAQADEIELNPTHPERYTVVRGDTLWDIAGRFLAKPWQWPEIWHDNPQIANPHWIYPGDVLVLSFVDGKPYLQVAQRTAVVRPEELKLSPQIRVEPLGRAIPTIPLNDIQAFLIQPKVAEEGEMQNAPYIVALAEEHIGGGAGDRVYVRGLPASPPIGYMVFRPGKVYQDAETGDVLGYEALYVAEAEFQSPGDPSTLRITKSDREVLIGDRILPIEVEKLQMRYHPHPPAHPVWGHIIAVVDGVSQIGQWNVVIIDRGAADGIEPGHVLDIRQSGAIARDVIGPVKGEVIELPNEKEGLLMVFRTYQRVSFGLVMSATRAIHLYDAVQNP